MFHRMVSFGSVLPLLELLLEDVLEREFALDELLFPLWRVELEAVRLADDVTGPEPIRHRISTAFGTSPLVDWRTCKFLALSVKPMARRADICVV